MTRLGPLDILVNNAHTSRPMVSLEMTTDKDMSLAFKGVHGTLFFMQAFGFSINLLTLFALVLAIGLVVDDAIIVVMDPLDGSTNASRRVPWYATALAAIDASGQRAIESKRIANGNHTLPHAQVT
mgnify:CR=1 FL=1